ncbi:hypothetical protein [Rhizobium freirei]|uniref:hypothetical protein n=1 Tax=Rhizobium freirei TaxID=1353277 RepID=UPI0005643E61|nr:hypothetical protein [Rhizobium freirei]
MTTRDTQIQYLAPIEGTWFLMDAQITVLGFKLIKDDIRHQHHDMRERKLAKARRSYSVDVAAVPEMRHV